MKAVLLALSAISVVSAANFLQAGEIDQPINTLTNLGDAKQNTQQLVSFTSAAGRGLLSGYMKGMYKNTNYKPQDKCLDAET